VKSIAGSFGVKSIQGFDVYWLNNDEVELAVVPELGAKMISLRNLRTEREWMWHPEGGLNLFRNQMGDDFSGSPLVGTDECLPTIAPCRWQNRALPDHGEVWSLPWNVDKDAFEYGILKTSIRLPISPFKLERTIELDGNDVCLAYQLTNLNSREESFLWAIHPLLRVQEGDQLELPISTRRLLNGAAWVDLIDSGIPSECCAKIFAQPIIEGMAGIRNRITGDRLEFIWDALENDSLGLWLTRGGWHGHHHFALEPTNAGADALAVAAESRHCGKVAASSFISWQICLRVSSRLP
jgi:hypothetical protein